MAERDLILRLRGENADLKAKLAESTAQVEAFKAANAGVAPGAAAAATALDAEAAAARNAGAAATQQAAQQSTVVLALREVRSAMAALAASTTVGGVEMTAALGRVAISLGAVEVEMTAVRASGGVVSPAQIAALEGYKAQLAGLAPQLGAIAGAQAGAAVGGRVLTSVTTQGANAMTGAAVSAGAMGGSFLRLLGPIGVVGAAIALLPTLIRGLNDAFKEYYNWIVNTVSGFNDQAVATRKAGETIESYNDRVRKARDENELLARALDAASKGIIQNTGDVDGLKAAYLAHMNAIRGVIDQSDAYAERLKKLRITVTEAVSFAEAEQAVQVFFDEYTARLKEGENAAIRFAQSQRDSVQLWLEAFEDVGKAIPMSLRTIAEQLGVTTIRQKELAERARDLAQAQKEAARGADDHAASLGQLAEEMSAEYVHDFATGVRLTAQELQGVAAGARDVAVALRDVKVAADIAFPVISGGHSQLGPPVGVPPVSN